MDSLQSNEIIEWAAAAARVYPLEADVDPMEAQRLFCHGFISGVMSLLEVAKLATSGDKRSLDQLNRYLQANKELASSFKILHVE